jgi:hypothetical protein
VYDAGIKCVCSQTRPYKIIIIRKNRKNMRVISVCVHACNSSFSYGGIATCWSNSSIYISLSLRTISFKKSEKSAIL